MLNANEAAAKTAMNRIHTTHGNELKLIEQRISGAASAGLSTVDVIFEGNVFDQSTAEIAKQMLLDEGYQVELNHIVNQKRFVFRISW